MRPSLERTFCQFASAASPAGAFTAAASVERFGSPNFFMCVGRELAVGRVDADVAAAPAFDDAAPALAPSRGDTLSAMPCCEAMAFTSSLLIST